MPKNTSFTAALKGKTETFVATFLLPIFFAYSGLKLHVISPVIFSMFVLMALVTTIMTSPLLQRVYPLRTDER